MSEGIFLIKDDESLVKMEEAKYDSEDLLQSLLEKYPDLLAGEQINQDNPRKWILVSREMAISSDDVKNRWSVDHLFLDQDGIPTLVEVKRSTDSRIRREVVGQMLDYAANSVVYWTVDKLRSRFESECEKNESDPEIEISNLVGDDLDQEDFWQKVKTNLQAGKIRMVFVADEIPSELKRIVEFLNEQMDPAEVIAIEIKQFIGEGLKSLVPRVVGQTQEALKRKGQKEKKELLTKQTFFKACDEFGRDFYENLFIKVEEAGLKLQFGSTGFSINADINGRNVPFFYGYSLLSFKQSIYTSFPDIERLIKSSEEINKIYREKISSLGIFTIVGKHSDLKLQLKEKINSETKLKITNTLLDVAVKIRVNGLK